MSTSTCRRPGCEALILAGLVLAAAPAAADYRDSYRRGLEAAGRESWPDVTRYMRAALSEQPREGEPVFVDASRTEIYLPHYYLGLALFRTGNCVAARREWEAARDAIRRSPFLKNVGRLNQECQKRAPREAAAGPAATAVEAEIRKAQKLENGVAALGSNPQIVGDEREALEKGLRGAREHLADARSRLEDGRRDADLGDIAKARELTERATTEIEMTRRHAMAGVDTLAASPPPTARTTDPAPARSPGPLPARAPAELVSAAHAYFEGRYEDVIRTLGDVGDGSGPAALQSHLLRAAARFALYALGGSRDEALRQAVVADVQAVRRMDPDFEPDASAFSPRFRALFKQDGRP
jgi:hypothetical protein